MTNSKLQLINRLVEHISEQMDWGQDPDLTNKDFEKLSQQIFDKTQKQLSVTTLKRVWGRVERVANPSNTTLDILAKFGGYQNWREFTRKNELIMDSQATEDMQIPPGPSKNWLWVILFAVVGAIITFFCMGDNVEPLNSRINNINEYKFESRIVSDDIPNSVVFSYDASQANDNAKIEIQQSWDSSKRIDISKEDSIATCIYYRPGFFQSKLVVDDSIIVEEDVFIQTRDWLGIVQKVPIPIYLDDEEIQQNGEISISSDLLRQYDINPIIDDVRVSLYNVQDFGALYSDDFEFGIEVNSTQEDNSRRCGRVNIFLLFEGKTISIPLAKKGCIAKLSLMTFDDFHDGSKHDLSAFGVDFKDFQSIKCKSDDKHLNIYLNAKKVYEMKIPLSPLKFKGVSIHFGGAGVIRNTYLKNSNEMIYSSNK